jgi:hypothetical protein
MWLWTIIEARFKNASSEMITPINGSGCFFQAFSVCTSHLYDHFTVGIDPLQPQLAHLALASHIQH